MKYASAAYSLTIVDHEAKKRLGSIGHQITQHDGLNNLLSMTQLDDKLSDVFVDKEDIQEMYVVDEPYEYKARRQIYVHCNNIDEDGVDDLKESDIIMFVKQSLLTRALRHFVAVNHVKKAVILSIRGSFTFAELLANTSSSFRTRKYLSQM